MTDPRRDAYKNPRHRPYAAEVGGVAIEALDRLAVKPEWRGGTGRHWLYEDHSTLAYTVQLLGLLYRTPKWLDLFALRHAGYNGFFQDNLQEFYTALPMHEGERDWIAAMIPARGHVNDVASEIRSLDREKYDRAEAVTAGRWQPVGGKDLLDRWWAWRRGIFEYEGHDSIDIACRALGAMCGNLVPEHPLPQGYVQNYLKGQS